MDDPQCQYDPRSCQSLLGYGRAAHARSAGICAYCDLGKERVDFGVWRQLSVDHVLPARLFPGGGRTLQSVFPNLSASELRKLAEKVNSLNLVTACNFCNSMTSRMNDISVDGILSPEAYGDVTSVDALPVKAMLRRLEERVKKVLAMKRRRVKRCLTELRKTFDAEVKPELQSARNRPVKKEVLAAVDVFKERLFNCRAYFPKFGADLVGQQVCETPFYEAHGYKVHLTLSQPLTKDDIDRLNALGHFINQSYLFFLYSVLESHGVLGSIESELPRSEDVDLLRRLRNSIGHNAGNYNPKDDKTSYKKLQKLYGVDVGVDPRDAQTFPLPIDQVLLPMTERCREYAKALLDRSCRRGHARCRGQQQP